MPDLVCGSKHQGGKKSSASISQWVAGGVEGWANSTEAANIDPDTSSHPHYAEVVMATDSHRCKLKHSPALSNFLCARSGTH